MRHTKFLLDVAAGEVTHTSRAFQFAWADGDSTIPVKRRPSSPGADASRHKLLRQHSGQQPEAAASGAAAAGDGWQQAEAARRQLLQPAAHEGALFMQQRELQQQELARLLHEAGTAAEWGQ